MNYKNYDLNYFVQRVRACLLGSTAMIFMLVIASTLSCTAYSQIISTVAGGGKLDGYSAFGTTIHIGRIGFDPSNNLYIQSNFSIVKVSQEGTLVSVAGNGAYAFDGDNGLATSASVSVGDFCIDARGNIYIADTSNRRIRKITPHGVITTLAGNGIAGSSGDGGLAINAQVDSPAGITVTANGDLYFLDNSSVRKISSTGIITSIAKWTINGFGGDGGNALSGMLSSQVYGIAADTRGNVYIADTGNNRIRKVSADGIISTVAGNGTTGFSGDSGPATGAALNSPQAVAVDVGGNLYIADGKNRRVRRVDASGKISTVAGTGDNGFSGDGGPAVSAQLTSPNDLAFDTAGNLHVVDGFRVRRISQNGMISTLTGNGVAPFLGDGNAATNAFLAFPQNPAIDAVGNIYFVDVNNFVVRKVSPNGRISTVAGNGMFGFSGDGGDATTAKLMRPSGIAVDAAGDLYIADTDNARVRKVDKNGMISTVAGGAFPRGPNISDDGGLATSAYLDGPSSLAFDGAGNLYIGGSFKIRKVTPAGIISTVATGLTFVEGMTFDSRGNLYFGDAMNARIKKLAPDGTITTVAGNGTFGFSGDGGLAINASLNRVSGSMAIDAEGALYFTDEFANRIRKISTDGIISTVIGNGSKGFSGDGNLAANARLNFPLGVSMDARGDLYVADTFNNRIRRISTKGGANYSDMWWAGPIENGWGMSIQQHASGVQVNALYVYDIAGQPRWYVMSGARGIIISRPLAARCINPLGHR